MDATHSESSQAASPRTILVVEDGPGEREALARLFRLEQFHVRTAANPAQALRFVREPVDLIVSDLKMGSQDGLDLLRLWRAERTETPFVMLTAYGDVESAVTAMKLGASDYLTKPVDPDRLLALVRHCLAARQAVAPLPAAVVDGALQAIVGDSPVMRTVREQIRRCAAVDSSVLVLGESGTGKELVAQALHALSPRREAPLVVVNMAAVPDTLVESELFGHVPGAFTGASVPRAGRFESAQGGTLFIDEVGDLPLTAQPKLLRALESRLITPLGSDEERRVDVRVVAATSRPLMQMVQKGQFREDLYYRLAVVTLDLPPLRARREDIPALVDRFVGEVAAAQGRPRPRLEPELIAYLAAHDWPGNVRQLRNALESMLVLSPQAVLTIADLPRPAVSRDSGELPRGAPVSPLDSVERAVILRTLEELAGNRTRAAEALGISVRTLQRRLKEWGIEA